MFRASIVFLCLCVGTISSSQASANYSEQEKIAYLLNVVGDSKVIFIRNGVEYPASEAKAHLQMKLNSAGASIQTVDDFINLIASHSFMTGEPYYIEFPDGTKIEANTWLREKLADLGV